MTVQMGRNGNNNNKKDRFKEKVKESCGTDGSFLQGSISNQNNIGADEVSEAEQRVSKTAGRQGRQAAE